MATSKDLENLVEEGSKASNPLQYLYDIAADNCPGKEEKITFSLKVGSWFVDSISQHDKYKHNINKEYIKGGIRYALNQMFNYLRGKK